MNNVGNVIRHSALTAAISALALIAAASAYAQTISLPQPEAPTTIFATKLGSADVDLSLLGSWNSNLTFTTGLLFAPGVPVQLLDSFPGLAPGFIFTQSPDLTISLLLMKKYFLDVSVLSGVQNNTIRMGYRGDPDEVLRSLVIGNSGITLPPTPFLEIPSQPTSSIGASAELVSGPSTNDLLLRWDSTATKHKTFIGKNELIEQHVGLETYTKGRYFFLPDTGIDQGSLVVYLEDPNGTVAGTYAVGGAPAGMYRLATLNDVVVDTTNGLVSLKNPVHGRVVVYYTKGSPVGSASIGLPGNPTRRLGKSLNSTTIANPIQFSWTTLYKTVPFQNTRRITIAGVGDGLLLWQPGDDTPFEIDNSYAFTNSPPTDLSKIAFAFEATAANAKIPTGYVFQTVLGENRYMVLTNASLRSSFANFYPFLSQDPSPPPGPGLLYGPNRDSLAGAFGYDMHVQFVSPITAFTLEQNIVPGSVQATVNGITETRFQVDPASGTLSFLVPIQPTDRVDVTWRKAEQGLSGGDILFAWQDRIALQNDLALTLSAGIRWNADPWSFSQEAYSKSGTMIAAAELQGKGKNYSWDAQGAVAYTDPDTTGVLRLFGMEGHSILLDLGEDNVFPGASPSSPVNQTPVTALQGLFQTNRGQLFYRDYRQYGALGSFTLQPIDWPDVPAHLSYADGSRMGPYNVLGSSSGDTSGQSLVFEFSINGTAGTPPEGWVGAQLPISAGTDVDVSTARSVTIRLQGLNLTASTDVYLQIGSITEDIDGTAPPKPKAEISAADAGFSFTEQTHLINLKVGAGPKLQGNGKLDSEDRNGNNLLDSEDYSRIVTIGPNGSGADEMNGLLTLAGPTTGWTTVTVALNDQDRAKLLQARGMRIILVPHTPGAAAAGYVLIDSVSIEASPFWASTATTTDKSSVSVQEIQEQFAPPASGGSLSDKFSDKIRQFHPNGEEQDVLEVLWGYNGNVLNPFSIQGFTTQGTGGIKYQTVVAYVRTIPTTGATYTFSLLDSGGLGVQWTLPDSAFGGNSWHELKVSRIDNTVRIDGNVVGAPVKYDSSTGDITQLVVTVNGATGPPSVPPPSGTVFIDEVYFTDPQGSFGAAFTGTVAAQFPGAVLKLGSVAVLSNVSIQQDVSLVSAGFSSLYGTPSPAENLSSRTEIGADVFVAHVNADVKVREYAGSFQVFGGHQVTLPMVFMPVTLMDAFSVDGAGGFSHENRVDVGPVLGTSVSADSQSGLDLTTGLLTQSWLGRLSIAPGIPLTLSTDLQLSQSLLGFALSSQSYGPQWVETLALAAPWEGGTDVSRLEKLAARVSVPPAPIGISVDASTQAQRAINTGYGMTQENDLQLSTSLLFKLGEGDSTLSVGYKRLLSVTTLPSPGPRFVAEADELGSVLSQQGYLLSAIPLLEVFSDNSGLIIPTWQAENAILGSYNPAFTVGITRNYGSRLLDLLIPSSADLSIGQILRMASSISQTDIYITAQTASRAVNLFGRLGSTPLLPMITTDEYSVNLSTAVSGNSTQSLRFSEWTASVYASMTGEKNTGFTFTDSFKWDQDPTSLLVSYTNAVQSYLDWSVRPAGGIDVPYISAVLGKDAWISHRESGSFTVNFLQNGDYHPATFLFGHATSLVFPEHGSIKGSVNVGADTETALAAGIIWRLAISFGIEAKLTF